MSGRGRGRGRPQRTATSIKQRKLTNNLDKGKNEVQELDTAMVDAVNDPTNQLETSEVDVELPAAKRQKRGASTKAPAKPRAPAKSKGPTLKRAVKAKATPLPESDQQDAIDDEDEVMSGEEDDGKPKKILKDSFTYRNGVSDTMTPFGTLPDIYADFAQKVNASFVGYFDFMGEHPINVATMCSGSESPILAINQVQDHFKSIGRLFNYHHAFSAEIVPFKQHYIQTNFEPPTILRDITELSKDKRGDTSRPRQATTAYGSKVDVPGNIDLLVVGSSCVDFSNLNNHRKRVTDGGESGDTFLATVSYMKEFSPKMVIFENVASAPWAEANLKPAQKAAGKLTLAHFVEEAGYVCHYIKVDTKQFYLPHTRQRGYMICIRKDLVYSKMNLTKDELIKKWEEWDALVMKFGNPATVGVEAFLLPRGDPRVINLQDGESDVKNVRKPIAWSKCKVGHQNYRFLKGYGDKHILTNWHGESHSLPDFYQRGNKGMTQRVLDTHDIAHLRNVTRGFDDRHYSRNLELSQNVYRVEDKGKQGNIDCLTPRGMPFNTFLGRRLNGFESLTLQGIPTDQLDLTNLTQANLQDLAGNAMTSVVVGATIFAGLSIFHKIFDPSSPSTKVKQIKTAEPDFVGEEALVHRKYQPTSVDTPLSIEQAKLLAGQTSRLCLCEDSHPNLDREYQKCTICTHTSCKTCGSDPKHLYIDISQADISARKNPEEFRIKIKRGIPTKFSLAQMDYEAMRTYLDKCEALYGADQDTWQLISTHIAKAITSELCLRSIVRKQAWEIEYDSTHARAVLTISPNKIEWLVYANAQKMPLGSDEGLQLREFPILRMEPGSSEYDFLNGSWEIWIPKQENFILRVDHTGDEVASHGNSAGLMMYAEETVSSTIKITLNEKAPKLESAALEAALGTWRYFPECGQAFNSFHYKIGSDGLQIKGLYLFFDHRQSTGDYTKHFFVFTHDSTRPDTVGLFRPYLGRLDPTFKQQSETQTVNLRIPGKWVKFDHISPNKTPAQVVRYLQLPKKVSLSSSCLKQQAILLCEVGLGDEASRRWRRNEWIRIDQSNAALFLRNFSWAVGRALANDVYGHANTTWHDFGPVIVGRCSTCVVERPRNLWAISKDGTTLVFVEDPEEAGAYERKVKTLPAPLSAFIYVNDQGILKLKVGMNPGTLIHKSISQLDTVSPGKIHTSWQLVTDTTVAIKPRLGPLRLQTNHQSTEAPPPKDFSKKNSLRPEQSRALTWALSRENDPQPFVEQAISEWYDATIGMRLWGRACQEVDRKGGVLAFDVGFGKTPLTIALILEQLPQTERWAKDTNLRGSIPLKATIIFVPQHLTVQWKDEIKKFAPILYPNVIVLDKMADLNNATLNQFRQAQIIIVSTSLCNSHPYKERLAISAGIVCHGAKDGPRAQEEWYDLARKNIASIVDRFNNEPSEVNGFREANYKNNILDALSTPRPAPSKRVSGAEYAKQKERAEDATTGKTPSEEAKKPSNKRKHSEIATEDTVKADINFENYLVLEAFTFARVIADEYHYLDPRSTTYALIKDLSSRSGFGTWLLSGTPELSSFDQVRIMADLLNVYLGEEDMSVKRKLKLQMTGLEAFMSLRQRFSPALVSQRHEMAQKFLDHFARTELSDLSSLPVSQHLKLVKLPSTEYAFYLETTNHVVANMFDSILRQGDFGDAHERTNEAITGCDNGRQAIISRGVFSGMSTTAKAAPCNMTPVSMAYLILQTRQVDLHEQWQKASKLLRLACWLVRNEKSIITAPFDNWLERAKQGVQIKDKDATEELLRRIEEVENGPGDCENMFQDPNLKGDDKENDSRPIKPEGETLSGAHKNKPKAEVLLRSTTQRLTGLGECILKQLRAQRFFGTITRILSISAGQATHDELKCSGCSKPLRPNGATILGECGHIFCNDHCLKLVRRDGGMCKSSGCYAASRDLQLLPASDVAMTTDSSVVSRYGKKVDEIITLIRNINGKGEKALVFVQHQRLLDKILDVLEVEKIAHHALQKGETAETLKQFQTKGSKAAVLVLNIGDESAAGSNLTIANHIIFVAPYLTKGTHAQQVYDAAMKQAIGRARRFGQEKHVHVYQFVAAKTIDVDILEKRSGKVLKIVKPSELDPVILPEDFEPSHVKLVDRAKAVESDFASLAADDIFAQGSEYA